MVSKQCTDEGTYPLEDLFSLRTRIYLNSTFIMKQKRGTDIL